MTAAVWIVVSARMASSRRPGKALADLAGRPLLEVLLERMRTVGGVSGVALATSVRPENDALAAVAEPLGVPVFRGDEDDVLRRHLDGARVVGAGGWGNTCVTVIEPPRSVRLLACTAHLDRVDDAGAV